MPKVEKCFQKWRNFDVKLKHQKSCIFTPNSLEKSFPFLLYSHITLPTLPTINNDHLYFLMILQSDLASGDHPKRRGSLEVMPIYLQNTDLHTFFLRWILRPISTYWCNYIVQWCFLDHKSWLWVSFFQKT